MCSCQPKGRKNKIWAESWYFFTKLFQQMRWRTRQNRYAHRNDTYGQQQVLGLQIAMRNLHLVTVMDGRENNLTRITGLPLVVVGFLYDSIEEFSTHHLFGNHEIMLRFFEDIIEADNVLVVHILQDINFVLQGDLIFLRKFRFCNNLDSIRFRCRTILSFLHNRKGTFTELLFPTIFFFHANNNFVVWIIFWWQHILFFIHSNDSPVRIGKSNWSGTNSNYYQAE